MNLTVEPLGPDRREALRAHLAKEPVQNLHLLALLEEGGQFLGCFLGDALKMAAFVDSGGGRVIPSSPGSDAELSALAAYLASTVRLRSCVGDTPSVEFLVQHLATHRPRLCQNHHLLSATADGLGPYLQPALRPAVQSDLPQLLPLAAQAAQERLGINPLAANPDDFKQRLRKRIEKRRTYVLPSNGTLVLKVDIASQSSYGAELEGIYTLPEYRYRGLAMHALGQLSRHLLSALPRLTLRAHGPLAAVARKVGFRPGSVPQLLVTDAGE